MGISRDSEDIVQVADSAINAFAQDVIGNKTDTVAGNSLYSNQLKSKELINKGRTVWYVDGAIGASGDGGQWSTALKTITEAIAAAGAGDVINIKALGYQADASDPEQYVEDLVIPYSKHDLQLIGVNSSGTRLPYCGPKIKNATATTLLDILAAGVHLENLQFNCTREGDAYGIRLQGVAGYATLAGSVGFTMKNCMIKNGSDTFYGLFIEGGYGGMIEDCTFQYCLKGIRLNGGVLPQSGYTIKDCDFKTINDAAITSHIDALAGSTHDWTIENCTFCKATNFMIFGAGGVSGLIHNCGFMDEITPTVANSAGKIVIPAANDSIGLVGCYGGANALITQSGD